MSAYPTTGHDRFEQTLRGVLHADADVAVPARLSTAVLRAVSEVPAERSGWWRPGGRSWASTMAGVMGAAVVALFGGWLLLSLLGTEPDEAPAPAVSDSPAPTSEPRPTQSPRSDPRIAGEGPWLEWTANTDELDRMSPEDRARVFPDLPVGGLPVGGFVTADGISVGVIDASVEGWGTRSPKLIPMRTIVRTADGETTEATIEALHEAGGITIGPKGIILQTSNQDLEMSEVARLMGQKPPRTGAPLGAKGAGACEWLAVWDDGRQKRVRLTGCKKALAKFGLRAADIKGSFFAWFSEDGKRWRRIRDVVPVGRRSLVATDDGFVALGPAVAAKDEDAEQLWVSANGIDWAPIPDSPGGELYPWRGRAVVIADSEIGIADAGGYRKLPELSALIGRGRPIDAGSGKHRRRVYVGDVGLVYISLSDEVVLFSPDLEKWSLAPLQDEWQTQCRIKRSCRGEVGESTTDEVRMDIWTEAGPDGPAAWIPKTWQATVVTTERAEGQP